MTNDKTTEGASTLPIAQVKGLKNSCLLLRLDNSLNIQTIITAHNWA
jgi:hypothetical protein